MTRLLRVGTIVAAGATAWVVTAAQIPSHARLPLAGVVPGAAVSQPFGCSSLELEPYDPFCPEHHVHTGIDLAAPTGTPVHSATGGTAHVGWDPDGAGIYVVVKADSHTRLVYCHLSAVRVVSGQAVRAGEVVGELGSTGMSTGPHLHFEIQVNRTSIDPAVWLASTPGQ